MSIDFHTYNFLMLLSPYFYFVRKTMKGLGIVHVLTGPDHLSALATLSAVSDLCTSFWLGVRWGIGHSTGLILVGSILIIHDYHVNQIDANSDETTPVDVPDWLGHLCETLVGFFMLFLGIYGFRRAFQQKRRQQYDGRIRISSSEDGEGDDQEKNSNRIHSHHHHNAKFVSTSASDAVVVSTTKSTAVTGTGTYHDDPLESLPDLVIDDEAVATSASLELEPGNTCGDSCSGGTGGIDQQCGSIFSFSRKLSAKSLAVFAGIIHGLAGPGGVLGVVPAVQLHDWKLAFIYLGCFCIASTLTMGCFASCYGLLSSGIGQSTHLEFQIHCFSSALSILVGITWLVLLCMGKLYDVFP